jgi:hypothetical protein
MFRHLATTWFGYLGKLAPEEPSRGFFDAQVEAFERFMREERGLSEVTILSRRQRVGHFLGSLPSRVRSVRQITVADIDRYLIQQSGRRVPPVWWTVLGLSLWLDLDLWFTSSCPVLFHWLHRRSV